MKNNVINEYFGGNPDTLARYDYTQNNSGVLGKISGLYNKLKNNKIYNPRHIKQEYYWNDGNTITFGYFQDSIDGEKKFKKIENGNNVKRIDANSHQDIVRACTNSYIRNAKARIDNGGYSDIYNAIMNTSACKGRLFSAQKVLTTWGVVTSARLKEIVNLLGIENPQEYYYVINKIEEYNLLEYINSNNTNTSGDGDEERFRIKIEDIDSKKLQRSILIVREYNSTPNKLVNKSKKLGNMTIAQYNSLIHQEEKEPKQVIKENNIIMNTKKYNKEFSNYISIMKEALDRQNFAAYEAARDMLDESIGECKHEKELESQLNTTNFGVLNHIFEDRLPELFKSNKKAVRNVIKLIKEDKNLSAQFDFYENIRKYKGKITEMIDPVGYLSHFNAVAEKYNLIDKNTIIESNKKLRKVLKENNVIPTDFISEEAMNLYKAGHNLLTKKQSLKNMTTLTESVDSVKNYMNRHKDDKINESVDPQQLIEEFENKLKDTLTESEMSFVKEITDWRSPIAEQRKEKLFNKFKNECIDKVNEMLKEDAGNVELEALKKQLEEQKFNKDSIVTDIAKLLEIRDILLDS